MYTLEELSPHGYDYFIFSIVTPMIASFAVLLRMWVRSIISRSFGVEDLLLLFSLFCFVGSSVTGALMALNGFGGHQDAIPPGQVVTLYKFMYASSICIYLSSIALRISLCLLFLRITQVPWQRWILYGIATITTIINLINLFRNNILYCVPVSFYWDPVLDTSVCVSAATEIDLLNLQYSISAAADWATSILPIFILRDWTGHDRAKMVTYGLLGMGIFASAASIAAVVLSSTAGDNGDYTFTAYRIFIAQYTEPFIGILAASFSTYRPLFRWLNTTAKAHFSGGSQKNSDQIPEELKSCIVVEASLSQHQSSNRASTVENMREDQRDRDITSATHDNSV